MSGPLDGIRVVDLTMNVLGPLATQVLGDSGADVIKVEQPDGDPTRQIGPSRTPGMGAYFMNLNRNKRSLRLDLKRPAARAALLRVIARADVFIHNIRAGAAARLGLDYAALRVVNPRLVYAAAGGFRRDGALRDTPAYDDIVQGVSGVAALNRDATGAPRYVPMVMADKVCGQVLAGAVAMALFRRERTGLGQDVHVPMLETMLAFNLPEHMWGATLNEPSLGLGYNRMLTPHRRPYATQDGHICVVAVTDDQWRRLFSAIGRADLIAHPDFASVAARAENIERLYAQLAAAMATRTTDDWLALLAAADLPCGRANTLQDLLDDDYLQTTGFFRQADHPTEGGMMLLSAPVDYGDGAPAPVRLPPVLGEHTIEVLREAGLAPAEIDAAIA